MTDLEQVLKDTVQAQGMREELMLEQHLGESARKQEEIANLTVRMAREAQEVSRRQVEALERIAGVLERWEGSRVGWAERAGKMDLEELKEASEDLPGV